MRPKCRTALIQQLLHQQCRVVTDFSQTLEIEFNKKKNDIYLHLAPWRMVHVFYFSFTLLLHSSNGGWFLKVVQVYCRRHSIRIFTEKEKGQAIETHSHTLQLHLNSSIHFRQFSLFRDTYCYNQRQKIKAKIENGTTEISHCTGWRAQSQLRTEQ